MREPSNPAPAGMWLSVLGRDALETEQGGVTSSFFFLNVFQNLNFVSEGASILLTWIINLVKWNAGHTKYKFDEATLGGYIALNH